MQILFRTSLIIFFIFAGCSSKGPTDLSRALTAAVKDHKLSVKKMENIISEYNLLRKNDEEKAREYVAKVLNVVKMGGDSTHIDVVRRQILVVRKRV